MMFGEAPMNSKERLAFWPMVHDSDPDDCELTLLRWNTMRLSRGAMLWSEPSRHLNRYLRKLHDAADVVRQSAVASVATGVTAGMAAGLTGVLAASLTAKAASNLSSPDQTYHLTIGGKLIK